MMDLFPNKTVVWFWLASSNWLAINECSKIVITRYVEFCGAWDLRKIEYAVKVDGLIVERLTRPYPVSWRSSVLCTLLRLDWQPISRIWSRRSLRRGPGIGENCSEKAGEKKGSHSPFPFVEIYPEALLHESSGIIAY